MSNLGKALKQVAKAIVSEKGPGHYSAGGKNVVCRQCEGDTFAEGSALLNTAGMTFMNLDWANKSAVTLACTECGHVLWFMKRPNRL